MSSFILWPRLLIQLIIQIGIKKTCKGHTRSPVLEVPAYSSSSHCNSTPWSKEIYPPNAFLLLQLSLWNYFLYFCHLQLLYALSCERGFYESRRNAFMSYGGCLLITNLTGCNNNTKASEKRKKGAEYAIILWKSFFPWRKNMHIYHL